MSFLVSPLNMLQTAIELAERDHGVAVQVIHTEGKFVVQAHKAAGRRIRGRGSRFYVAKRTVEPGVRSAEILLGAVDEVVEEIRTEFELWNMGAEAAAGLAKMVQS